MAKRILKRVFRNGKVTRKQLAHDQELRRKIMAEFPPTSRALIGPLSASLKLAIEASPKSVYQLAKEAGISQIMVSRFLSGQRDIRLTTADRLARALGMKLVAG
jgi:transcriptional regulator with XRE-family HTH domain